MIITTITIAGLVAFLIAMWFIIFPIITTLLCTIHASIDLKKSIPDLYAIEIFDRNKRIPIDLVIIMGPFGLVAAICLICMQWKDIQFIIARMIIRNYIDTKENYENEYFEDLDNTSSDTGDVQQPEEPDANPKIISS